MRMVLHHIADRSRFAADLRRALAPNGRLAIIDFAPGALPHLTHDHGVSAQSVVDTFAAAGFRLERQIDNWGGRSYPVLFTAAP